MSRLHSSWTCLASSTRLQRSSQVVSVVGSKAFIFGGELRPRQPVDNQIDVVDVLPSQDETAVTAKTLPAPLVAPSPRVGTASAVIDNTIFLFSGRGGVAMDPVDEAGKLWAFSPATSAWSVIEPAPASSGGASPVPSARSYHAMTSDGASNLFVHAGCPAQGRLSDLWAFNIRTRAWTELAAAPSPPRGGTSITYFDGKIYRMGGFDGKSEQGGSVDVFDIKRNAWETIAFSAGQDGPEARSVGALAVVSVNGRDHLITLFGEGNPSSLGHEGAGKMLRDVWAFDLEAKTWERVEPEVGTEIPAPRGWFGADVVSSTSGPGAIIVHGGLAEDNSRLGDVWKLTISS